MSFVIFYFCTRIVCRWKLTSLFSMTKSVIDQFFFTCLIESPKTAFTRFIILSSQTNEITIQTKIVSNRILNQDEFVFSVVQCDQYWLANPDYSLRNKDIEQKYNCKFGLTSFVCQVLKESLGQWAVHRKTEVSFRFSFDSILVLLDLYRVRSKEVVEQPVNWTKFN